MDSGTNSVAKKPGKLTKIDIVVYFSAAFGGTLIGVIMENLGFMRFLTLAFIIAYVAARKKMYFPERNAVTFSFKASGVFIAGFFLTAILLTVVNLLVKKVIFSYDTTPMFIGGMCLTCLFIRARERTANGLLKK
jgi:hypothetical protein